MSALVRTRCQRNTGSVFMGEQMRVYPEPESDSIRRTVIPISRSAAMSRRLIVAVAQGDERGGLARPARRVQHEVALGTNQAQEFIDVHAVQRRDGVVLVRAHRSCDVEEAHGPIMNRFRTCAGLVRRWVRPSPPSGRGRHGRRPRSRVVSAPTRCIRFNRPRRAGPSHRAGSGSRPPDLPASRSLSRCG